MRQTTRFVESVAAAAVILLAVLASAGASGLDVRLAAVAVPAFAVLTAAAYGFHALTFDEFRLAGRRARSATAAGLSGPFRH